MERGWQKDPKADDDDRKKRGGHGGGKKGGVGFMKGCQCQADMCSADLNAAKPYHRRHRVCEQHAKAPVVLVVGIQQRFCQQCSRFHELSEFDEAKRSCRRRLAGHNERRRKTSGESQAEASSSHQGVAGTQLRDMVCGQVDDRGRIQITLPESSSARKHFHIR